MSSVSTLSMVLWILLVVLVVGVITVFLSWTAGRLDRMHIRLATAQASFDRQLIDREGCARRVATSGVIDPASAVVTIEAAEAAHASLGRTDRAESESALSQVLRTIFDDKAAVDELWAQCDDGQRALLTDLGDACVRVRLAQRFHDDLATRTVAMRSRRLVRMARLAGHAPWPAQIAIDDDPPRGLLRG